MDGWIESQMHWLIRPSDSTNFRWVFEIIGKLFFKISKRRDRTKALPVDTLFFVWEYDSLNNNIYKQCVCDVNMFYQYTIESLSFIRSLTTNTKVFLLVCCRSSLTTTLRYHTLLSSKKSAIKGQVDWLLMWCVSSYRKSVLLSFFFPSHQAIPCGVLAF